jgi:hypothetical protein
MRIALAFATLCLVLTTAPAVDVPLDCQAIKYSHECNATPGCWWPECLSWAKWASPRHGSAQVLLLPQQKKVATTAMGDM